MEKRVFIAILLSFLVLAVYQTYFAPAPPPPASEPAAAGGSPPATSAAPSTTASAPPRDSGAPPAAAASASLPAAVVGDTTEREVVVDTEAVHAVFSTRGGVLTTWQLKRYLTASGTPLDLVPEDIPPAYSRPFTIGTEDPNASAVLASALYRPSTTRLSLGDSSGSLTFEYENADGLRATKTFRFRPDGKAYVLGVEASVTVNGTPQPAVIDWGPALGYGYNPDGSREFPRRSVELVDDKVTRVQQPKMKPDTQSTGAPRFAGVEEQYFLSAALPGNLAIRVRYDPVTLPVPGDAKRTRAFVDYRVEAVNPDGSPAAGPVAVRYFMGPKDLDVLRSVDPQLARVIDFGFFAFLVVPLLQALKWVNGLLGNYGWSIVVLTILINLAIFPLRHRSMVSMRRMQALQPEIKVIQERYKKFKVTDPERQKMNQEMMALYKEKGVNPASGCVPMLLTMPILFAFYSLLYSAIELRNAPFFGWIHDLSARDPFFIWPLLMGVTMLAQQRMMPSTADPMQQKMFMIMPVVFTVMFLWAPSGLVVYWLMSNLMAIGQQYITNRMIGAPVGRARALAPAKPASGGKPQGRNSR